MDTPLITGDWKLVAGGTLFHLSAMRTARSASINPKPKRCLKPNPAPFTAYGPPNLHVLHV